MPLFGGEYIRLVLFAASLDTSWNRLEVNWMIRNSIVIANDSDVEFYLLVALRFFEVLLGWYFL
jgi:hypothetical protein